MTVLGAQDGWTRPEWKPKHSSQPEGPLQSLETSDSKRPDHGSQSWGEILRRGTCRGLGPKSRARSVISGVCIGVLSYFLSSHPLCFYHKSGKITHRPENGWLKATFRVTVTHLKTAKGHGCDSQVSDTLEFLWGNTWDLKFCPVLQIR